MNYEALILDAIGEAKIANRKIIKIGIPAHIQLEIIKQSFTSNNGIRTEIALIRELFGIPVEVADTLQITTEFSGL